MQPLVTYLRAHTYICHTHIHILHTLVYIIYHIPVRHYTTHEVYNIMVVSRLHNVKIDDDDTTLRILHYYMLCSLAPSSACPRRTLPRGYIRNRFPVATPPANRHRDAHGMTMIRFRDRFSFGETRSAPIM